MRLLLCSALALMLVGSVVRAAAPQWVFVYESDGRVWNRAHEATLNSGVIVEFVPEGQIIKGWTEMLEEQVAFIGLIPEHFFMNWRAFLRKADPEIAIEQIETSDGSIIAKYRSTAANEMGVRRFFSGPDGIYMLAYQARIDSHDPAAFAAWVDRISKASVREREPSPQETHDR